MPELGTGRRLAGRRDAQGALKDQIARIHAGIWALGNTGTHWGNLRVMLRFYRMKNSCTSRMGTVDSWVHQVEIYVSRARVKAQGNQAKACWSKASGQGIMEKKMETTIMENQMETTIMGYIGVILRMRL